MGCIFGAPHGVFVCVFALHLQYAKASDVCMRVRVDAYMDTHVCAIGTITLLLHAHVAPRSAALHLHTAFFMSPRHRPEEQIRMAVPPTEYITSTPTDGLGTCRLPVFTAVREAANGTNGFTPARRRVPLILGQAPFLQGMVTQSQRPSESCSRTRELFRVCVPNCANFFCNFFSRI